VEHSTEERDEALQSVSSLLVKYPHQNRVDIPALVFPVTMDPEVNRQVNDAETVRYIWTSSCGASKKMRAEAAEKAGGIKGT
jgi:hypothetical protein